MIEWDQQDEWFGLDHSSKKGRYKDFVFDIRCDYEGDSKTRPEKCGCWLGIYFMGARVGEKFGGINALTKYSEGFIIDFLEKYQK